MSRTFTDVWKEAAELSDEERATLAGLLIESLEGDPDPDVEAAWAAEIEKRVAELDAGTVESIPWEQVRQRLLKPGGGHAEHRDRTDS
jgi:putative addiction module component (TIGR02574 family)